MRIRASGLGFKLNLVLLAFLVLFGAAMALLIYFGFSRTQDTATTRSREGLEAQGRQAMLSSAVSNSGFGQVILDQAMTKGHDAARFLEANSASGGAPTDNPGRLGRAPSGALYDPNAARATDVWAPTDTQLDATFARDLGDSARLDALFPALLEQSSSSPVGDDSSRIFFLSARGLMRSYPKRDVALDGLPPELSPAQLQLIRSAGPAANPQRDVVWSDTHNDPAAGGLLISGYTPVYAGDEYRGLIGVDLSLASLLAKVDAIRVTPNGYAFVIDRNGGLLPGASSDVVRAELANDGNRGFAGVIARMRAGGTDAERVTVNGEDVFVAYAPLGSYGGSLALVAPVDDVTAEAAAVASAIRHEGNRTETITIGTMIAFLVLGLVGTAWLNRTVLLRPIAELVRGTKAIATGDLSARIPSGSRDELGALAISFNMMTDELRGRRDALRAEVAERRRAENELHALFAAMTDLVLVLDRDGTLLRQAPTRAAGHPVGDAAAGDIMGKTVAELLGEEQAAPLLTAIRNSLATGDTETVEYSLTMAGEQRWFSATVSPLTDDSVVWVARDITERVSAQHLLEQRVEERTRELSALLDVSRGIASTLEPQRLVGVILEQLRTIIDFNGASVLVLQGDALVVLDFDRTNFPDVPEQRRWRFRLDAMQAVWPAMLRGEPVIIDDVRGDSVDARGYQRAVGDLFETALRHVHAFLAVPLVVQGRATGMLTVSHARAGYFTLEHARLVRAIADQAAVAIENAQLLEETKARARETEALIRADEGLFRSLSLDAVFQALTDVVVDVLEVEKSLAMGPDEALGHYVVRSSRNMSHDSVAIVEQLLAGAEPLAQDARDDGTMPPIVIEDTREADERLAPIVSMEGIRSMMVVPVRSERELHGRFVVAYTARHPFSAGERRLMLALADRAAVAIENARLYERAQRAASLEERQRLARDLHDSVSQALYGIALGARTAQTMLERNAGDVGEPLDYVLSLAEAGLAEMRALIFELRPDSLETEGLVVAIEKQAAATRARYRIDVEATLCDEPPASLVVKEALYRIAQEAMHNTVKHAHAGHIELALTCTDAGITLVVRDDGAGFDTSASFPGHMGLQSMRERAARVGGAIAIESAPDAGTRIEVRTPLP